MSQTWINLNASIPLIGKDECIEELAALANWQWSDVHQGWFNTIYLSSTNPIQVNLQLPKKSKILFNIENQLQPFLGGSFDVYAMRFKDNFTSPIMCFNTMPMKFIWALSGEIAVIDENNHAKPIVSDRILLNPIHPFQFVGASSGYFIIINLPVTSPLLLQNIAKLEWNVVSDPRIDPQWIVTEPPIAGY